MIFRWSIGPINTSTNKKHGLAGMLNFLYMAKLSILSFQRWFPQNDFVVLYNGYDFSSFKETFQRARPSIGKVRLIDSRQLTRKYSFKPEPGVWWKWVPFRLDAEETEICVDTDIICMNDPLDLREQIMYSDLGIVLMSEFLPYFSERVCGNFWDDPILKNRIPVNCGLTVFKPKVTFEKEFFETSKQVKYGATPSSFFIDEQGCFNVGLYKSDIPFALLSRRENIYGHEFLSRLEEGVDIEICHFIGRSKTILDQLRDQFFINIHDDLYTLEDIYNQIIPKRYLDLAEDDIY